ncbi:MAG: DoxX family protein [Bernardetiaceae bacterium]|nr:DoxX family protein [Bernardetiaceae bacterium]
MKRNKIIYWIATGLVCVPLLAGVVFDLLKSPEVMAGMTHLGYPEYLATILGVAKLLAVVALLYPGFPRLKEWAYAGVAIDFIGAGLSHLATGDPINNVVTPFVLFGVLMVSYWFYHASKAPQVA